MKKNWNARILVQASFFVSLSIILTRIASIMVTPTLRVGFGEVPLIMSGIILGPIVGGAAGFVADMIGFIINPQGVFHLGFTISSILWGVIPGLLGGYFLESNNCDSKKSFLKILIILGITRAIIAVGLNTYWLSQLYGKAYIILFWERVTFSIMQVPIEAFIMNKVISYIVPVLNFE